MGDHFIRRNGSLKKRIGVVLERKPYIRCSYSSLNIFVFNSYPRVTTKFCLCLLHESQRHRNVMSRLLLPFCCFFFILKKAEAAAASSDYFRLHINRLLIVVFFLPQCCTRSHGRFVSACSRSAASSPSMFMKTDESPKKKERDFTQNVKGAAFHLFVHSQVWCGASCAGETGEGDRAGGDSAHDRGAASSRQNLQCVLPTWRPVPGRGEFYIYI